MSHAADAQIEVGKPDAKHPNKGRVEFAVDWYVRTRRTRVRVG